MPKLLILGCGYTGKAIAKNYHGRTLGTTRTGAEALLAEKILPISFDDFRAVNRAIRNASAILISTPPNSETGLDPSVRFAEAIAESEAWLGLLSTTGVYGDHNGGWVDEHTKSAPNGKRGAARLRAESFWQDARSDVAIFRLAGIYGKNRSAIDRLRAGNAKKIVKSGQYFSRIHVDDIVRVVLGAIARDCRGEIYNLADNLPTPPEEPLDFAAALLGLPELPAIPFENAALSEMAKSFYADSKRVANAKIRAEFGELLYPDYKAGLTQIFDAESHE